MKIPRNFIILFFLANILFSSWLFLLFFRTESPSTRNEIPLKVLNTQLNAFFSNDLNEVPSLNIYTTITPADKIDVDLYEAMKKSQNSDQRYNVFIEFREDVTQSKRVEILRELIPDVFIKYNYHMIPYCSISTSAQDLIKLLLEPKNSEIVYIKSVHTTVMDLNSLESNIDSLSSDQTSWDSPFSAENWWLKAIGADSIPYTGKNVRLAIMDTGITVHPDFFTNGDPQKNRIVAAKNFTYEEGITNLNYIFDAYGHGTHVAGIAGGNGYLSDGKYRGVAPDVDLINAKISNSTGYIWEDDMIAGIEWCMEEEADIINMSFGYSNPEVWGVVGRAIKAAVQAGAIVVCSAGNSGSDFFTSGTPATALYSIAVGATDINNHVVDFSSVGPSDTGQMSPDLCAPGLNIIAPAVFNSILSLEAQYVGVSFKKNTFFDYFSLSGTSMSCPMVSGAIALFLEAFPDASPESIRNALIFGATAIERPSSEGYGIAQGAGLLNVTRSLEYLRKIKDISSSVNYQAKLFPRNVPYAPYDLLRFPGDTQQLNLSLYCGENLSITINFPAFSDIAFRSNITSITANQHDILSIPLLISILPNASKGDHLGTIDIIDSNTAQLLDQIQINITVAYPRGTLYFDSYHGLNDAYPIENQAFAQINLYHTFWDLQQQNYSSLFFMQNWSYGYNAGTDAQLLTETLLSQIDLLVLQTPVLPYSAFEIDAIKNFFLSGGSIMFLGTKSELMCINSLNTLFTELGVDIQIQSHENIMETRDYGFVSFPESFSITDFADSSSFFSGVNSLQCLRSCTFSLSSNAQSLAEIQDQSVIAWYNGTSEGKGRFLAVGDYYIFRDGYYNDPAWYSSHTSFLFNSMQILVPPEEVRVKYSIEPRNVSSNSFDFYLCVYNPQTQFIYSDLINNHNLSVIFTEINGSNLIDVEYDSNTLLYRGTLNLTNIGFSSIANILNTTVQFGSIQYQKDLQFFYMPVISGYQALAIKNQEFVRSMSSANLYLNQTLNNGSFNPYISIFNPSYFSSNPLDEPISLFVDNGTDDYIGFNPSDLKNAGIGVIYCFSQKNSTEFFDTTPDRLYFLVKNYNPIINNEYSSIGDVKFSELIFEEGVSSFTVLIGESYSLALKTYDGQVFEDNPRNFTVICTLYPIIAYNGYINFIYSGEIPNYPLEYDSNTQKYLGTITIPENLVYYRSGKVYYQSLETDLQYYYALLWITVRDLDGGSVDAYIILTPFERAPNINNFTPILMVFLGLIGLVLILNFSKFGKKNRSLK